MGYSRLENESDEELVYRICSQKDAIGTWDDVADVLNELCNTEYTSSKYRKQYQAFQKMFEANQNKFTTNDTYLEQIRKEKEELQKERLKLQTLNVERNRLNRAESRQELFYEYVGSMLEALPLPAHFEPLHTGIDEEDYLVCLADIHYGATFKSVTNEYSPEIVKKRFDILFNGLYNFIQKNQLSHINVASLGDSIQGILRLSDLKLNDSSIVKATVEVSRLIASFLNDLSQYVDITYYHVPNANHTQIRVLGAKANELGDEDLEYLIGNYIKDLCKNNYRINVVLAKEGEDYIETNINENEIIMLHGHQVKNMSSAVRDLSILHQKFYQCVIMGHLHGGKEITDSEGVFGDNEILITPSFIGSDPYADGLCKTSKSAVKIYGFTPFGHMSTNKILLN